MRVQVNEMDKKVAISIEHVSKKYKLYDKPTDRLKEAIGLGKKKKYHREHAALQDINIQIMEGETVGIIGTNGSGKSTLLKIITGVLNQTAGEVKVNGRISALLELGAGFNMEYTGIENVYLNGTMIGFTKEEVDAKLEDILAFADIGDFVYQPVKTYSSGMFVRLAFAVAINIDPEILIVDEALSVGDTFFQNKCYKKFEEFKKMGKTILFVSHDLSSINKYCDRVVLLNKGEKLAEGSASEMIDMYKKVLVNQVDSNKKIVADQRETDIENWKQYMSVNPNVNSYGSEYAEIIDFGIVNEDDMFTSTLRKNETFTIKMKVKFLNDVECPIFAFTIKDIRGTDVTGTNTFIEKAFLNPVRSGEVKEISFTQKMNLQGGQYLLSLGCTGYKNEEFEVYHRLYDVVNISVVSDKNTVGFYDMNSEILVR